MSQAELNKKWQELEQKVDENLGKEVSFYVLRDLISEIITFPLQDVKMTAKVLELLYRIHDTGETKLTDEKDKNNLLEEIKKAFVSFAGYGLDKPIKVQDIILNVVLKKIEKNEASEISVKTLSALLETEGTDTVLNDDGKSISWRRFIISLSPEVIMVRDKTMNLLFDIAQKNNDKYDLIKNIISAYSSTIHSLEVRYRTDSGLTAEEKTEVLDQIKKAIECLQRIKKLYDGSKIEHLDIWHQISMAVWNPYDDKSAIKTQITEAEELKKSIWENNNYILFKLILRPGYKSRKENPNPAKNFKIENIALLEEIIKFGEKEKSIYGSVKFFFKDLGEKNPEVFEQILKRAEKNEKSYLWYYLGFGFSKIDKAVAFAKEQEKSKNIIHIKAGIDAFYHIDELFEKCLDKNKVFKTLQSLINKGNEIIKTDSKEIFWWSMSPTEVLGRSKFDTSDDATKIIELFILLLDSGNQEVINKSIEWLHFAYNSHFDQNLELLFKHLPAPQIINIDFNYFLQKIAKSNPKLIMNYIIEYTSSLFQKKLDSLDTNIRELNDIFECVDSNEMKKIFIIFFDWFIKNYPSADELQKRWMKESFNLLATITDICSIRDRLNEKIKKSVFKNNKPYSLLNLEKVLEIIDPVVMKFSTPTGGVYLTDIKSICLLKLAVNWHHICRLKQEQSDFFDKIDKIMEEIERTVDIHILIEKTNKIISQIGTQRVRQFYDYIVELYAYFDLICDGYDKIRFIPEAQDRNTPDLKAFDKGEESLIECKHLNTPYDEDLNLRVLGSYSSNGSRDIVSKIKNKIYNGKDGLLDKAKKQFQGYDVENNCIKKLFLNFTPGMDVRLDEYRTLDEICGEGYFQGLENEHDIKIVLKTYFIN